MATDDDMISDENFPEWDSLESAFMDLERFLLDFKQYAESVKELISKDIDREYEEQRASIKKEIRDGALKLAENEKEEDWLFTTFWEFHGDQIFNESVLLYLFSIFETAAEYICNAIKEKKNISLSRRDLSGGIISSFKSYLITFGGFTRPSHDQWLVIEGLYDLRNIFAHGAAVRLGTMKRIKYISKLCCDDKHSEFFVTGQYMPTDFYRFAIKSMEDFLLELKQESLKVFSGLRMVK